MPTGNLEHHAPSRGGGTQRPTRLHCFVARLTMTMTVILGCIEAVFVEPPSEEVADCPESPETPSPFPYEFGWEINIAVPHAYHLHRCNKLLSTSSCDQDLSVYYWFSPNHTVVNCGKTAAFLYGMSYEGIGVTQYLANVALPRWTPVPHKSFFSSKPVVSERGSGYSLQEGSVQSLLWPNKGSRGIAILNKQHFGGTQKNGGFISAPVLKKLLSLLDDACSDTDVMYYRNWAFDRDEGGTDKEGSIDSHGITEAQALASNQRVTTMQNLSSLNPELDARETQMRALSRFSCFIAVHGGNSELAANFGGKMVLYIRSIPWYDKPWTMSRLVGIAGSNILPVRSDTQLVHAVQLLAKDQCESCSLS
eukprot:TRINITY_DN48403_c0_g1_i1.p1 TRINITY_DN48403_c0_g1~~TRINITY_DN48403_c0_g1_i1.p1  ORF type:complete len:365 (+),score=40.77 TRINITY_DN48403_c0_g1_i1:172-1266(+)